MGYTYYQYMAMVAPETSASLETLQASLDAFYSKIKRPYRSAISGNQLTLTLADYKFYVYYATEAHVLEESREMAQTYIGDASTKAAIARCATRFEMHGDDDPDMDYFNDSLYLQEQIEALGTVYILDPIGGNWMNV
jgi:hypothetical protein